jgi:hypothetical protein
MKKLDRMLFVKRIVEDLLNISIYHELYDVVHNIKGIRTV